MADYVVFPQLKEDITEATLTVWHKRVGDWIREGEVIAEVETVKLAFDIEAPIGGMVLHCLNEIGDLIAPGTAIAIIGARDEDISHMLGREPAAAPPVNVAAPVVTEATPSAPSPPDLERTLLHLLLEGYNNAELDELCFELGVDYEDFPAEKRAKARELVRYLSRRGRLGELVVAGQRSRPHLGWPLE